MPANLTPEYMAAEARYKAAKTTEEKLVALKEMLRTIPKHKGTDRMQGDIKRRISQLKKEANKKKGPTRKAYEFHIPKEGAGQVAILGPPNSGKSLLVDFWTSAQPEVADYPYTTRRPTVGMFKYRNVLIQLIDLPPISADFYEPWVAGIVRNTDLILILLDLSRDEVLDDIDVIVGRLRDSKIILQRDMTQRFLEDGTACKPTVIAGNKIDVPNALVNLELVREYLDDKFDLLPVSIMERRDLDQLGVKVFEGLRIIRVYTKVPGKPPDTEDPVILRIGSTVEDFARSVHKDFVEKLKFAKIWGRRKFEGQMVNKDHVLSDEDVVELHI